MRPLSPRSCITERQSWMREQLAVKTSSTAGWHSASQPCQAVRRRLEAALARSLAAERGKSLWRKVKSPDYIKQRSQEGIDAKENPEEKVPEKPPTPKESPHFYRKGTTPPRSPEASLKQSHSPPPSPKPTRKQNPSSGARLNRDKRSVADEQVAAVVNKPLMAKAPSKEAGAAAPSSKYSGRHHVPNPSNGELHSQYHGYYVKLNAPKHPPEDGEEDGGSSHPSSALVHKPSPNKWSPPKSVTKPVAKESKAEPKAKKSELAIPKNQASNDSCPPSEKEANSGPNSVMIVLVMLLNIGLAILFVHFLT
ncbi:junctophilin-1 [Pteropus alecto]|uniref:junctophilin-1 n=1 Tax=Pteropus alecto TaxID=9402 RepID=UPI000D539731|nr:junctophilin-1 [Pteropus alecto]